MHFTLLSCVEKMNIKTLVGQKVNSELHFFDMLLNFFEILSQSKKTRSWRHRTQLQTQEKFRSKMQFQTRKKIKTHIHTHTHTHTHTQTLGFTSEKCAVYYRSNWNQFQSSIQYNEWWIWNKQPHDISHSPSFSLSLSLSHTHTHTRTHTRTHTKCIYASPFSPVCWAIRMSSNCVRNIVGLFLSACLVNIKHIAVQCWPNLLFISKHCNKQYFQPSMLYRLFIWDN